MPRNALNHAFLCQRGSAKIRGIPFHLTFEQWLTVWRRSGHLAERGRRRGQFVMGRRGDVGAYQEDNVEIIRTEENLQANGGERHNRATLTVRQVTIIRQAFPTTTIAALARRYKTSHSCISHIVHNRSWK